MSPKLLYTLLAVGSFALYYLLLSPLWTGAGSVWAPSSGGVKDLRTQHAQYEASVEEAKDLFGKGKKLQAEYESVDSAMRDQMAVMVPEKVDPVRLLNEITAIAKASGLSIAGLSSTETATGDKLRGAYDISFGVQTSYPKFKEFIHNYETSLRLFTLQSVSFASPAQADDLITFQVKLRTYYLK